MRDEENPEDGECDLCFSRVGNASLATIAGHVGGQDVCETCLGVVTDPRDVEIAALRADRDEARHQVVRLEIQRGEEAQTLIDFCATLGIAEEDVSWDALRARVAAFEAVERAAREVCDEADEPEAAIVRLDAALAALEVPRG